MIKIGILGIFGRMGQVLMRSAQNNPKTEFIGGSFNAHKQDVDYFLTDNPYILAEKSDVLIDFTTASALKNHLSAALQTQTSIVIGTTGFDAETTDFMHQAAQKIPILQSGNMSLGVNILSKLVKKTADILDVDWDIEITEAHHRYKIDSPSGTAIMLGKAAAQGRKIDFDHHVKLSREGIDASRPKGEIGFSTIRAGSIIGEHHVLFAHDDEMITLSHRAQNRAIFANGAVFAAQHLVNMPAGFYDMMSILDI